jgi:sugar lactone lactonase YvrE
MRRFAGSLTWVVAGLFAVLFLAIAARGAEAQGPPDVFPEIVPLPNGFAPEGVVSGYGPTLFAGSLATGDIYRANLITGEGEVVVDAPEGRTAVGLSFDRRTGYVYAAGGDTGMAFVYDPSTGESVTAYTLTDPGTFVNDVVVTRDAAYFTDSFRPVLYKVPLGPGGAPGDPSAVEEIMLSGDFTFVPNAFNTNGIDARPNGQWLIIVNSATGELYRVDPNTGEATLIDLGGETLPNGDGILLQGFTLYVVQNQLNQIAKVKLTPGLTSGEVVDTITNPAFDVPTTVASFGPYLYAVNARFGTPVTPDTEYAVVQVRR